VATLLGGHRAGPLGAAPDILHELLAPEVKHRKSLPAWLLGAMAQAKRNARGGRLPVVVLHAQGEYHRRDLVVVELATVVALLKRERAG